MTPDPEKHHRRSIRIKGYDYSQYGGYFITICTYKRKCLFGGVVNGKTNLNDFGNIAHQYWLEIPNHFPGTMLDEFVIMPNHVHGIIVITNDNTTVGARHASPLLRVPVFSINKHASLICKSISPYCNRILTCCNTI